MVARTRLGRFFQGLTLHIVAALIIGYFAFQGYHGNYGLLAQRQFEQEVADLTLERDTLRTARAQWEHRVGLLRSDRLDPDLLDELARRDLGFVKPNDLVLLNPSR
ncbi:MAG TPA: septum formation initiator family protein [Xanthobacteraceae bacterium]|nr:septum formation initiator family protein [Xanthobacteraceae bacterium]